MIAESPDSLIRSFTAHTVDRQPFTTGRLFTIEAWQEYIDYSLAEDIARGQPRFTEGIRRLTTAAPDRQGSASPAVCLATSSYAASGVM